MVISSPAVCDVCVFHAAVFGEVKLFAVLGSFDLPFSNLNLTWLVSFFFVRFLASRKVFSQDQEN